MFDLIVSKPAYKLDRKGLRFVLSRMKDGPDEYAVAFCLDNLVELPDLAPDIAVYLSSFVGLSDLAPS
jgi:hypothetical protein